MRHWAIRQQCGEPSHAPESRVGVFYNPASFAATAVMRVDYLANYMDASTRVAAYFEDLIERCNSSGAGRPTSLPLYDQNIFYVISTRCEMDMGGFESVLDQLLEESEIAILIAALNELGCTTLADAFSIARDRLTDAGFFDDEEMMVCDLATDSGGLLDDIEETVRNSNLMWDLDDSLAKLLPEEAK